MHCSVENAAFFVRKLLKESRKFELARLKKKKNKEKTEKILAVCRLSGLVLSRCLLASLGVLFVTKTLKDER